MFDSLEIDKKVFFITGASGLIGTSLCQYLIEAGAYVIANSREEPKYYNEFINQDVMDKISYEGNIDFIIHLAGLSYPAAFKNNPVEVMEIAFIGTKNILDLAKEKNAKILYVSSGEVYGLSDKELFESTQGYVDILNYRSCYPIIKRACETLCSSYIKEYGVDVIIARPCHIFGIPTKNDNRVYAQFIRNAINREDILLKSLGKDIRSYCYVKDCITAFIYIVLYGKNGEAYNISSETISIKEFAEKIAKINNLKIAFQIDDKITKNPMNKAVLNSEKLRFLGWKPKYTIESALIEMFENIKN